MRGLFDVVATACAREHKAFLYLQFQSCRSAGFRSEKSRKGELFLAFYKFTWIISDAGVKRYDSQPPDIDTAILRFL